VSNSQFCFQLSVSYNHALLAQFIICHLAIFVEILHVEPNHVELSVRRKSHLSLSMHAFYNDFDVESFVLVCSNVSIELDDILQTGQNFKEH